MCMTKKELRQAGNENLLEFLERAIVLETKNNGNGKNPFDRKDLKKEILRRLKLGPKNYSVRDQAADFVRDFARSPKGKKLFRKMNFQPDDFLPHEEYKGPVSYRKLKNGKKSDRLYPHDRQKR